MLSRLLIAYKGCDESEYSIDDDLTVGAVISPKREEVDVRFFSFDESICCVNISTSRYIIARCHVLFILS